MLLVHCCLKPWMALLGSLHGVHMQLSKPRVTSAVEAKGQLEYSASTAAAQRLDTAAWSCTVSPCPSSFPLWIFPYPNPKSMLPYPVKLACCTDPIAAVLS